MDLGASKVQRVSRTPGYEWSPAFSPDGGSIVFPRSAKVGEASHIYQSSLDGQRCREITTRPGVLDSDPSFSRDGARRQRPGGSGADQRCRPFAYARWRSRPS